MAWMMAAAMVAGSILQTRSANSASSEQMKREAIARGKETGRKNAATAMQAQRMISQIPGLAGDVRDAAFSAQLDNEIDTAEKRAMAEVMAAAAGVSGTSVDQTIQDIEQTGAYAALEIEAAEEAEMDQLNQDLDDLIFQADSAMATFEVDTKYRGPSVGTALGTAFLAGVQGYLGG